MIVSGHVQGVGFRYFTRQEAQRLALTGQVKNLANGDVECLFFGETVHMNDLLHWLKKGPTMARVDGLLKTSIPYVAHQKFLCL